VWVMRGGDGVRVWGCQRGSTVADHRGGEERVIGRKRMTPTSRGRRRTTGRAHGNPPGLEWIKLK
jgi:hypothetical protein